MRLNQYRSSIGRTRRRLSCETSCDNATKIHQDARHFSLLPISDDRLCNLAFNDPTRSMDASQMDDYRKNRLCPTTHTLRLDNAACFMHTGWNLASFALPFSNWSLAALNAS